MSKFVYQSAGTNKITYQDQDNIDHTLTIGVDRTWTDSSQTKRFERLSFKEFQFTWVGKPGCDDKCNSKKSTETFTLNVGVPAPESAVERAALLVKFDLFVADVKKALDEYNVINGALPPASAEFRVPVTP